MDELSKTEFNRVFLLEVTKKKYHVYLKSYFKKGLSAANSFSLLMQNIESGSILLN